MRPRVEEARCSTMTLAGWSDSAFGDQTSEGRCRLGCVIGPVSSTFRGPRHTLQWPSKFAKKLMKSSPWGEVYASCEMIGHVALRRNPLPPCVGASTGMAGKEDCGDLSAHLRRGVSRAQFCWGIQRALGNVEPGNVFWFPGSENPGGGLIEVESDVSAFSRLLQSGLFSPGALRSLRVVAFKENGRGWCIRIFLFVRCCFIRSVLSNSLRARNPF